MQIINKTLLDIMSNTSLSFSGIGMAFTEKPVYSISMILFFLAAFGCLIASWSVGLSYVGNKDDWNQVKPTIAKISILAVVGAFCLCIFSYLFFVSAGEINIMFLYFMVFLSFGLSVASVAISAITRMPGTF